MALFCLGIYTQEYFTTVGCTYDSTKQFDLHPITVPGMIDTTVCGLSLLYEGITYSTPGSYGLFYQNGSINGCDSSAILNLELIYVEGEINSYCENGVLALAVNITSMMPLSANLAYTWYSNGNVVSNDSIWYPQIGGSYSLEISVESAGVTCIYGGWSIEISDENIADCLVCRIVEVDVEPTDCDSADMFNVVLDMMLSEITDEQFVVVGNGENYGSFKYSDLPIELGPLDGSEESNWEFFVFDALNPDCGGAAETGIVSCDPSGIFSPSNVVKLKVHYDSGRPYFIPPENDLVFTLWDTNGQLLTQLTLGDPESIIYLDQYTHQAGVVIIRLSGNTSEYVAKAVITR